MKTRSVVSILSVMFFSAGLIFFHSCKDNAVSNNGPTYNLAGRIDNWTDGSMKLVAELYDSSGTNYQELDSCMTGSDGSFALNIATPSTEFLSSIKHTILTGCTGSIFVNPPNAKSVTLLLSVYDTSRRQVGVVARQNFDSTMVDGSFYCDYIYCDMSVSVTGTETCVSGSDTTKYLISWGGNNAWNKVVTLFNHTGSNSKWTISNTEPSGGSWRFWRNH